MRLTKTNLARMTYPIGKPEHIVYDDDLPGFGLRMHPSGRATWFVQFRLGQKQRRVALGTLATTHSDEARRLARETLAKVQLGRDPQKEKSEAKALASHTLGILAESYLSRHAATRLRASSLGDVRFHLRIHWKPLAGSEIGGIKRADVAAVLSTIAKENGPFAANRARAALSAMFSWAMGEGLADLNPVVGTNKAADEVARDRVLTNAELALVWRLSGQGDFGTIVRLLILTGARREEVAAMRWDELEGNLWRLPAARTKNARAHELHLPSLALEVLSEHPRVEGRDLIFGASAGPFSGWSKAKSVLDTRMLTAMEELNARKVSLAPWRIHDIRRTVATGMASIGVAPHVIEAVLNHVSGFRAGVAGVYNRASYGPEKREALARWADHVVILAGGES